MHSFSSKEGVAEALEPFLVWLLGPHSGSAAIWGQRLSTTQMTLSQSLLRGVSSQPAVQPAVIGHSCLAHFCFGSALGERDREGVGRKPMVLLIQSYLGGSLGLEGRHVGGEGR